MSLVLLVLLYRSSLVNMQGKDADVYIPWREASFKHEGLFLWIEAGARSKLHETLLLWLHTNFTVDILFKYLL